MKKGRSKIDYVDDVEDWLLNCNQLEFERKLKELGVETFVGEPAKAPEEYDGAV